MDSGRNNSPGARVDCNILLIAYKQCIASKAYWTERATISAIVSKKSLMIHGLVFSSPIADGYGPGLRLPSSSTRYAPILRSIVESEVFTTTSLSNIS